MSVTPQLLRDFFDRHRNTVLVEVTETKGSTPREAGAWMLVAPDAEIGTIGGGQLEFLSIARAREAVASGEAAAALDIPLGPEIGQCCGGRVAIGMRAVDDDVARILRARAETEYAARTHVYVFGAGHVGNALGQALSLLPFRTLLVDNRAAEIARVPPGVEAKHVPVQEALVREAPPASCFVVLTHDHGLDFLIASEALLRNDALYVGMIGSKTKRATFKSWLSDMGHDIALMDRLTMPIGGADVKDKRPEVIAALTAAEIVRAVAKN
ncbi:xanthine dehydrogenase accessory protein XdhC [Pelagibacterium sp. 26DY04]|uniref:xanthine dehydrogenase accessory protein XdhC n=1 Tax=Pelagibacterium sp. 26DY04 TaxID=2967130 RepID=UPI002815CE13|nr:xanthine dehydrogenase accessory protein XdhC [Pelagibacterium sp. 26DY04]WMT86063.1 xanthine dehydrogenase accessory protein XdhC [Pelagibacterium sp. 26DY04]